MCGKRVTPEKCGKQGLRIYSLFFDCPVRNKSTRPKFKFKKHFKELPETEIPNLIKCIVIQLGNFFFGLSF